MRKLHLLSNAHLDPVWLWEWEEGAGAALSTFRAAASFCEEFDGYVFNHNEALLYQWVEDYEPELFKRIQKLVKQGRWHIMGGWYLQPDCNMPSGESMVRQILSGRHYFQRKFQVKPTTAINFDSFGHSRGLVQIMKQAGFDSYIFMRPDDRQAGPQQEFVWVGFAGSELMAFQVEEGYNSKLGHSRQKIEAWLEKYPDKRLGMVLWGVGNHGGGPTRKDLKEIYELINSTTDVEIIHSTPEQYFSELSNQIDRLPRFADELNPRFVGCYTSMIRLKQKHRLLENELFRAEKMLSFAALQGLLEYPKAQLDAALHDLMVSEFHDILPGSSIQPAEEASLHLLGHGIELASRLKARAFFALAIGQQPAAEGEYPILVYNPHPYPVKGIFACEFVLADPNWEDRYSLPIVYQKGKRIPSQPEQEHCNLAVDWRKRVVFAAELAPTSMNRFDCRIEMLDSKPAPSLQEENGAFLFQTDELTVRINACTGLMDQYIVNGISYLQEGAFCPQVIEDNADSWRMDTNRFEPVIGQFQLMEQRAGSEFSGIKDKLLPSVRVIEDGEVRTVIEALLEYRSSVICLTYKLPKSGSEVEVHIRLYWNEKDKLLKLQIPTTLQQTDTLGQTMYGLQKLADDRTEAVAQKWSGLVTETLAVTLINNGTYGLDSSDGELRPTLVRSPGYTAHPFFDRPLMPADRFSPRIDQGERMYTFWLNAGDREERMTRIDREALSLNEQPYLLSFFPHGEGKSAKPLMQLEDETVLCTAFKQAEDGPGYIIRLFEPTGQARTTTVTMPAYHLQHTVKMKGFEIKSLRFLPQTGTIEPCTLME